MALTDNPDYRLRRIGESEPDLFTQWYNKYVKNLPTPGSQFFPPSTVSGEKPPAGLATPGTVPQIPAVPSVPQTPGIAPDPTSSTPILDSLKDPTAMKPAQGWSERLSEGLRDPAKYGLLAAGLTMMATPPREYPYSGGEIIGRAGLAGLGAFQDAATAKRRDQLAQAEADYRSARLEIEKQKLSKLDAEDTIISRDEAVRMGIPWAEGKTYGQVAKVSPAIPKPEKPEKKGKPDFVEVQWTDSEGRKQRATVDQNREDFQELMVKNPDIEIVSDKKGGSPAAGLETVVRGGKTFIINKIAGTSVEVKGLPESEKDDLKPTVFAQKWTKAEVLTQEDGWLPSMKGYQKAVAQRYKKHFGASQALMDLLLQGALGEDMGGLTGEGEGLSMPPTSQPKKPPGTKKTVRLKDGTLLYFDERGNQIQ